MLSKAAEILISNVQDANKEIFLNVEELFSGCSELASHLCRQADNDEIFYRDPDFINAYGTLPKSVPHSISSRDREFASSVGSALAGMEKACLCLCIADELGIKGLYGIETFFDDVSRADGGTVACINVRGNEEALAAFSKRFGKLDGEMLNSVGIACRKTEAGVYNFASVPEASDGGEPILGFIRPAYSSALFKVAEHRSKSSGMTFSLFSHGLYLPKHGDRIRMLIETETNTPELFANVSSAFGMRTLFSRYDGGKYTAKLTVNEETICGFLTFLFIESGSRSVKGLYCEL